MGIYKRLVLSQRIFEKPKHSVRFITSVPCLIIAGMNFLYCKFHLFITYLAYENNKHVILAIEQ